MLPNTIHFSSSDLSSLFGKIKKLNPTKIFLVVDENTNLHCFPKLKADLNAFEFYKVQIVSGEENKNLNTCTSIWKAMTDAGLDRKSLVLNLGGGVIGDMGGFCASTYKRGIRFIQLPTTLLSMVDASVGGKLGIDFDGFKNHIGVFNNPEEVFICSSFLNTLSRRELRSGFAEIVKHALIADAQRWQSIKTKKLEDFVWDDEIKKSVEIKWNVVSQDPTEKGLRKILNFGHTLGHAIETFLLFDSERKLLHGEAISLGMILESWLSVKKCGLTMNEFESIKDYLIQTFGKPHISSTEIKAIVSLTQQDKKNESSKVMFSLLKEVGNCVYDVEITNEEMTEALDFYVNKIM
ncbi:MAG: 3-dehydroquinate synthase [Cytophagales bacterium]